LKTVVQPDLVLHPFVLHLFCFTAPCQFIPLNLCPQIFGLISLAGCLHYAISLFLTGMSLLIYAHFFKKHSQDIKQGMGVIQCNTDFLFISQIHFVRYIHISAYNNGIFKLFL